MNMKISIGILLVAVLLVGIVMAHENFAETKQLIDSNISCDNLSNEQLEEIGDYLMEQMHPGESHEAMHNMMGGEDSETTKLMHINMAKMMYCDNGEGMNNMMNMMASGMMGGGGMMSSGMMSGKGMMGMNRNMMSGGMMNGMATANYGVSGGNMFISYTISLLIIVLLVLLIIFLAKKIQ